MISSRSASGSIVDAAALLRRCRKSSSRREASSVGWATRTCVMGPSLLTGWRQTSCGKHKPDPCICAKQPKAMLPIMDRAEFLELDHRDPLAEIRDHFKLEEGLVYL